MKINLSQIMKRAHEIAKKMVGDWYTRLALALRQAWKEAKTVVENGMKIAVEVMDKTAKTFSLKDTLKADGYKYLHNGAGKVWVKEITMETAEIEARKAIDMGLRAKFCGIKNTYVRSLVEIGKELGHEIGKKLYDLQNNLR